jgi:mRNA interferase RelE/StbE
MKSLEYNYFYETALKNLKSFDNITSTRIIQKIEESGKDPMKKSNVKHLVDFDISYRLSVGDYRVLFERDENLIF